MKIVIKDGGIFEVAERGWIPLTFFLILTGLIGALICELLHVFGE